MSQFSVNTPKGVQCPTAAVQTVRVAIRNCCDHVVGYEVRKPRPGEKGFKQCQCAEKRAGQNHDFTTTVFSFEALPAETFSLDVPARLLEIPAERPLEVRLCAVPLPPAVRPPVA